MQYVIRVTWQKITNRCPPASPARFTPLPARAPGRLALPISLRLTMRWKLGRRAGLQWQAGLGWRAGLSSRPACHRLSLHTPQTPACVAMAGRWRAGSGSLASYFCTDHLSAPACAYPHADRCIAQAGRQISNSRREESKS